MASPGSAKKRKHQNPLDEEAIEAKRLREAEEEEEDEDSAPETDSFSQVPTAGRIKRMVLRNFICHDHLVMDFNQNVNFIVGRNGSGKSAIMTGIIVGLGGRASATQRGESYKSFIKNGTGSCSIEITLINEGPRAYLPDVYGDAITVIRNVSQSSSTVIIKNEHGATISRKKADLVKITSALNIQVDNPISILTQKNAKTFLIQPKPENLYKLFMQATQLESIGNNYKEALQVSQETKQKMKETKKELENEKKQIDEIKEKIIAIDHLEAEKQVCEQLNNEAHWARVIAQEGVVAKAQKVVQNHEKALNELVETSNQNYNGRADEIDATIEEISQQIKQTEEEASQYEKDRDDIKKKYEGKKEEVNSKQREHRTCVKTIASTLKQIKELNAEITRLEEASGNADEEKARLKETLARVEEEIREVDASLQTTNVHQAHVDSNKGRLEREEREYRVDVEAKQRKLRELKEQLNNLTQQSGGGKISVYGRNVERLLKRIDEEVNKGRFKQRPRGPLGASIKMKEEKWTALVEKLLGGLIGSFCVDNVRDGKLLGQLMDEVYGRERKPEIICSKFLDRVHDVRRNSSRTERYSNIYDVIEISDTIVANCIIDQRSPESILLIPTDNEAIALLQHVENVPENCKYAFTKKGDTYYPAPGYRTYSGYVQRPRYLQTSSTQVILSLKQEIATIESDLNEARAKLNEASKKLSESKRDSNSSMSKMAQLRNMKSKLVTKREELRDQIRDNEADDVDNRPHFIELRSACEKQLEQHRIEQDRLADEVKALDKQSKEIGAELQRCRELTDGVDQVINPLKTQIRKLQEEKRQCQIQMKEADKKIVNARHALQEAGAQADIQKRTLQAYIDDAQQYSERIETKRSEQKIKELIRDKRNRIQAVEQRCGSRDDLQQQLDEKSDKYDRTEETLGSLIETNEIHLQRVARRRKEYKDMRTEMGERVEKAFTDVLTVRQYKGSLKINYYDKTLTLDVAPQNTTGRDRNETMTLSGGERSYSTVAFILALWECTNLPFYFLDEFDVFMDKVNRCMIMEILLEHAKAHKHSQYGFFTPLDASIVKSDQYLTIHQLEAPER